MNAITRADVEKAHDHYALALEGADDPGDEPRPNRRREMELEQHQLRGVRDELWTAADRLGNLDRRLIPAREMASAMREAVAALEAKRDEARKRLAMMKSSGVNPASRRPVEIEAERLEGAILAANVGWSEPGTVYQAPPPLLVEHLPGGVDASRLRPLPILEKIIGDLEERRSRAVERVRPYLKGKTHVAA